MGGVMMSTTRGLIENISEIGDAFANLPNEVNLELFSWFDPETSVNMRLVQKYFAQLGRDNLLWKRKFICHFPHRISALLAQTNPDWYTAFQNAYIDEYEHLPQDIARLFSLVKEGRIAALKTLLKDKSLLDKADKHGNTLLDWAQKKDNEAILDYFYELAAAEYTNDNVVNHTQKDAQGRKLLYWAIACHKPVEFIELLIQDGADIRQVGDASYQAIHLACMLGRLDVVKLLLKKNPALRDKADALGQTPLLWAASRGHDHIVQFLADTGANINQASGDRHFTNLRYKRFTPLQWACENGHLSTVKLLLNKKVQLTTQAMMGMEAIHIACEQGFLKIVEALIEADPALATRPDVFNQTPILWAASRGYDDIVKFFIDKKVDLNTPSQHQVPDFDGWTPLHWACAGGHVSAAKMLIENGASLDTLTATHSAAIHLACREGHLEIIKLLLQHDPTCLNKPDSGGQTPILWAASRGHAKVVQFLMSQGADVNLQSGRGLANQNYSGYTALHWACEKGHTRTIRALLAKYENNKAKPDLSIPNIKNKTAIDLVKTNPRLAHELKLLKVSKEIKALPDDYYRLSFSIFGRPIRLGYSDMREQKAAVKALKKVVFHGQDKACLFQHKKALRQRELPKICHHLGIKI